MQGPTRERFLRGSVALLGVLLGLTLEVSRVGSWPKHVLLVLLSTRGVKFWNELFLRIKANIGIMFFDFKKQCVPVERGQRRCIRVTTFCPGDTGVGHLNRLGTFCFQEPSRCQ